MNIQNEQQPIIVENLGAYSQPQQTLFTIKQYENVKKTHTAPALRNLIFKAKTRKTSKGEIPGNGLIECGAIIRVGRKILIDDEKFLNWMRQQNNESE